MLELYTISRLWAYTSATYMIIEGQQVKGKGKWEGEGGGRKKEKRKGNVMSNVYHCGCRASLVLAFEMLENCRSK